MSEDVPHPSTAENRLRADLSLAREELAQALSRLEVVSEDLAAACVDLGRAEAQAVGLSQIMARTIRRESRPDRMGRGRRRGRDDLLHADIELVRASSQFKMAWYLRHNLDVAKSGVDPIRHFVEIGGLEGRDPGPTFDSTSYLDRHPQLRADRSNPLVHFLRARE